MAAPTFSNNLCDDDAVWGKYNMDLGEQNLHNAIWAQYQPVLITHAVPTGILTAAGGRDGGGVIRTVLTRGFDATD